MTVVLKRSMTKRFTGIVATDDVSLRIRRAPATH